MGPDAKLAISLAWRAMHERPGVKGQPYIGNVLFIQAMSLAQKFWKVSPMWQEAAVITGRWHQRSYFLAQRENHFGWGFWWWRTDNTLSALQNITLHAVVVVIVANAVIFHCCCCHRCHLSSAYVWLHWFHWFRPKSVPQWTSSAQILRSVWEMLETERRLKYNKAQWTWGAMFLKLVWFK